MTDVEDRYLGRKKKPEKQRGSDVFVQLDPFAGTGAAGDEKAVGVPGRSSTARRSSAELSAEQRKTLLQMVSEVQSPPIKDGIPLYKRQPKPKGLSMTGKMALLASKGAPASSSPRATFGHRDPAEPAASSRADLGPGLPKVPAAAVENPELENRLELQFKDAFCVWESARIPRELNSQNTYRDLARKPYALDDASIFGNDTSRLRDTVLLPSAGHGTSLAATSRSGARSSASNFDGTWVSRRDGELRGSVKDKVLTWAVDGTSAPLVPISGTAVSLDSTADGGGYSAYLVGDALMKWSDGDVWCRVSSAPEAHLPSLLMMGDDDESLWDEDPPDQPRQRGGGGGPEPSRLSLRPEALQFLDWRRGNSGKGTIHSSHQSVGQQHRGSRDPKGAKLA